jgi:hypothetical protein
MKFQINKSAFTINKKGVLSNKEIIIQLIEQDLKHNRLIWNLQKLGMNPDLHALSIINVVEKLMGLEVSQMTDLETNDLWYNTYADFLRQSVNFSLTPLGEELRPFAEQCYKQLIIIAGSMDKSIA